MELLRVVVRAFCEATLRTDYQTMRAVLQSHVEQDAAGRVFVEWYLFADEFGEVNRGMLVAGLRDHGRNLSEEWFEKGVFFDTASGVSVPWIRGREDELVALLLPNT